MKFTSLSVYCRIGYITRYLSILVQYKYQILTPDTLVWYVLLKMLLVVVSNIRILLNFCAFLHDYETIAIIAMLGKYQSYFSEKREFSDFIPIQLS